MSNAAPHDDSPETGTVAARIASLELALSAKNEELVAIVAERDRLRQAYQRLLEKYALLERRLTIAKAERIDVAQLELEFAETKARLEAMGAELEAAGDSDLGPKGKGKKPTEESKPKPSPKGRRDLRDLSLPEERIELLDDALEATAKRIGFEESYRAGYRRGGPIRIVVARATYKLTASASETTETSGDADTGGRAATATETTETKGAEPPRATLVTVALPKELLRRSLLAPSLLAHLMVSKYHLGLPFYRLEEQLAGEGFDLDRGSMCRAAEDVGASLGGIVEAMAAEARATAFCLATDATGVAIQPEPLADKSRQPCRKGHFFVVLADRDHIFFEYQAKHTGAVVCDMLRGYSGYVQADAHAIYEALFRGEGVTGTGQGPPHEVGCWSHARRYFWEAAVSKYDLGREALLRLRVLFSREASFADLAPAQRKQKRQTHLRPLVDDFFAWARAIYDRVKHERGLVASAFGYAVRQEPGLRRFLDDGRLRMENNAAERALRRIATGRKAWLFFGSDDHASAAANLFSLLASCKLHNLEPEAYLTDVIRVMPYWPAARLLELAPRYWARTRARLDPVALAREVGPLVVPPPEQ